MFGMEERAINYAIDMGSVVVKKGKLLIWNV